MKTKKNKINKYQIYWLILKPLKGRATKRDVQILNKQSALGGYGATSLGSGSITKHFPSKKVAMQELRKIKRIGLNKPYRAYLITDAQYGMTKNDYSKNETVYYITSKQKKDSQIVK